MELETAKSIATIAAPLTKVVLDTFLKPKFEEIRKSKYFKCSKILEIIFKREIAEAENPEAKLIEKEAEYAEMFANPYRAAERGIVDDVILPSETRAKVIAGFKMLENKAETLPNKKHGNIPL